MSNFSKIFFLLSLVIISCDEVSTNKGLQTDIAKVYLQGELKYEYYNDSTIREVYKVNKFGHKQGRIVRFTPFGGLKRLLFINAEGDTVGDDSRFNSGQLSEHFFRLSSNELLFYAKFSESGEVLLSEGRPFFLRGRSEVHVGDTLTFYLASPIIPGFQTHVKFGQIGEISSQIDYINDLRQFTYKKIMPTTGSFNFVLKIQIKDTIGNIIIQDFDTTKVVVYNKYDIHNP